MRVYILCIYASPKSSYTKSHDIIPFSAPDKIRLRETVSFLIYIKLSPLEPGRLHSGLMQYEERSSVVHYPA